MTATAPSKPKIPEKTDKEVKAGQLAKFHVKWHRMLKVVAEESGVVTEGDAVNMKRAFAASLTQAARLSFADMGPGDLMAASKKLDEKWDDILSWLATGRYVDTLASYGIALETQGEAKTDDPTPNGPSDMPEKMSPSELPITRAAVGLPVVEAGPPACVKCGKELSSQEVDGSIAVNEKPHCKVCLGKAVTARFTGRDDGDPGPAPPEPGRR